MDAILSAAEFKVKMDAKRVLLTAVQGSSKPEVARNFLLGLLRTVSEEFDRVLLRAPSAPTSITISLDTLQISPADRAELGPLLTQVRTYLISLGYAVSVSNGVATISW